MSMETCLEQICRSTQEAVGTAKRQKKAIQFEKERVSAKCNTATDFIHSKLEVIRDHLNTRKAFLYLNLDHASSRHTYLKHKSPKDTLDAERGKLDEMQKSGEGLLAALTSKVLAALGEVHKARDRLKKVQKVVTGIQSNLTKTHISPPSTTFEANPKTLQSHLSTFGRVEMSAFVQDLEHTQNNSVNLPPYEYSWIMASQEEKAKSDQKSNDPIATSTRKSCSHTPGSSIRRARTRSPSSASGGQVFFESEQTTSTLEPSFVKQPIVETHPNLRETLPPLEVKKQGSVMSNRELPPLPQEPISTHTSGSMQPSAHSHGSHSQKSHESAEVFLQATNPSQAQEYLRLSPTSCPLYTPLLPRSYAPLREESRSDLSTYGSPFYLSPPPPPLPPFPPHKSPQSTEYDYVHAPAGCAKLVVIPPSILNKIPQSSTSAEGGDDEEIYDVPYTSEPQEEEYENLYPPPLSDGVQSSRKESKEEDYIDVIPSRRLVLYSVIGPMSLTTSTDENIPIPTSVSCNANDDIIFTDRANSAIKMLKNNMTGS